MIKDYWFNVVRTAHYPNHPEFIGHIVFGVYVPQNLDDVPNEVLNLEIPGRIKKLMVLRLKKF